MKKLGFIATLLLFAVTINAKKNEDVKIINGSVDFLTEECVSNVDFDWSNARWEALTPIEDHYTAEEMEKRIKQSKTSIVFGFNDCGKSIQLTTKDDPNAKYTIKIKIVNMDKYFSVGKVGKIHKLWADIKIIDNTTKNNVCTIRLTEFKGDRDSLEEDSFKKCFYKLGQTLANLDQK